MTSKGLFSYEKKSMNLLKALKNDIFDALFLLYIIFQHGV